MKIRNNEWKWQWKWKPCQQVSSWPKFLAIKWGGAKKDGKEGLLQAVRVLFLLLLVVLLLILTF